MKTFEVPVRFTFAGTVTVRADNKDDALKQAREDFGCCAPACNRSHDGIGWEMDMHPEKKFGRVAVVRP
jgi:hypothetical protein